MMFDIFSVPPAIFLYPFQLWAIGPLPAIDARHFVALVTTQVRVVDPLLVTDAGDAVNVMVGAGVITVFVDVEVADEEVATF